MQITRNRIRTQKMQEENTSYCRCCRLNVLNSYPVICSWTEIIRDVTNNPGPLTIDLTNDDAPLSIWLDVKQYSKRDFTKADLIITIQRMEYISSRSLDIYVCTRELSECANIDPIGVKAGSHSLPATLLACHIDALQCTEKTNPRLSCLYAEWLPCPITDNISDSYM